MNEKGKAGLGALGISLFSSLSVPPARPVLLSDNVKMLNHTTTAATFPPPHPPCLILRRVSGFTLRCHPIQSHSSIRNAGAPSACVFLFQRWTRWCLGPDQCHVNVHVNELEVSDFLLSFSFMSFFIYSVSKKTLGQIQGLSISLPHSFHHHSANNSNTIFKNL